MHDEEYMELCLLEASKAWHEDEVPVGALITADDGTILSRAHNMTRAYNNPTAHAEIIAIEEASKIIGNYRLTRCSIFVTMEPCVMCAGAIIEARIKRLVFGCYDKKRGAFGSVIDLNLLPLNHKVAVTGGILKEKSEHLLIEFFKARRGTEVVITGPTRNRLYA